MLGRLQQINNKHCQMLFYAKSMHKFGLQTFGKVNENRRPQWNFTVRVRVNWTVHYGSLGLSLLKTRFWAMGWGDGVDMYPRLYGGLGSMRAILPMSGLKIWFTDVRKSEWKQKTAMKFYCSCTCELNRTLWKSRPFTVENTILSYGLGWWRWHVPTTLGWFRVHASNTAHVRPQKMGQKLKGMK